MLSLSFYLYHFSYIASFLYSDFAIENSYLNLNLFSFWYIFLLTPCYLTICSLYFPRAFNHSFTFLKIDQKCFPSNIALINGNLRRISTFFHFLQFLFCKIYKRSFQLSLWLLWQQ